MNQTVKIQTINGIKEETIYNINDFPYNNILFSQTVRKNKITYLNIPAAFDIETTNVKTPESSASTGYAFMYHWQICIDKYVIFGRTWEEWIKFIDNLQVKLQLTNNRRLVIYVHNLAFEFQFFRNFVNITETFITKKRKILKACIRGIEFRCSYILSNMSLEKFCENSRNVVHYKLTDTFDYSKLRTPSTILTDEEISYCYNDVRGLCECIADKMKDDNLAEIPLTSTGYVRRDYRNAMKKNPKNRDNFLKTQLSPELYTECKLAFRGGDTHANRYHVNKILENVTSYDIQSSYPACMTMNKFPMSKFMQCRPSQCIDSKYAWVAQIRLENALYIGNCNIPYIPLAKCQKIYNYINDNGRILKAELLEMTITDIDYKIISTEYKYDKILFKNCYMSKYDYLPDEFRTHLIELFTMKTQLKGIKEKEYEYMKSKNKVNASYGMMVTDIASPEIIYKNSEYIEKERNLKDVLDSYYKSRNNFLSYQHGIWVTCHARYRLREMLTQIGYDVVYCDTDSIKFLNNHKKLFDAKNIEIKTIADEMGAYAYDKNGVKQYMGVWDYEGIYEKFKTLGSKKYIYQKNDKIVTTVAGLSKEKGAEFFTKHGMEAFKIGCTISDSGHLSAVYNDDLPHTIEFAGEKFTSGSNVALFETEYRLGITNEYAGILGIDLSDFY